MIRSESGAAPPRQHLHLSAQVMR
ncbi:GtrA family protein, partial [Mycobacterium tuberculosis]